MITKTFYRLITIAGLLALVLSACGPAGAAGTSSDIHAWVDQPVGGALLPLAPFTLKAHARHSSGRGITRIQFLVNDVPVGAADTDAAAALAYAETGWNPSAPGRYMLSAQAFAGQDFAYSETTGVCVSDKVKEASAGFTGDCENPAAAAAPQDVTPTAALTPTPTATTAAPVGMKMGGAPDPVYYGACASGETTTLAFNVFIDHPESADTVDVAYSLLDGGGATLRSDRISVRSTPPTQTYSLALDMNAAAAGLGVPVVAVQFHPEAVDVLGSLVGTAAPQSVKVVWCAPVTAVPPTKTPISTPIPPTFTPLPVDSTPPTIQQVSLSAKEVLYTTGCGPNSLTVTAHVSDPSGIGHVTLFYNYSGAGAASLPMASIGGDAYQATINAGAEAYPYLGGASGTINLRVEAGDTAGNTGSVDAGGVPIEYCPG